MMCPCPQQCVAWNVRVLGQTGDWVDSVWPQTQGGWLESPVRIHSMHVDGKHGWYLNVRTVLGAGDAQKSWKIPPDLELIVLRGKTSN